jgi:hypothetical protein
LDVVAVYYGRGRIEDVNSDGIVAYCVVIDVWGCVGVADSYAALPADFVAGVVCY